MGATPDAPVSADRKHGGTPGPAPTPVPATTLASGKHNARAEVFPLGARVRLHILFANERAINVRIDLGGGDIGVTQDVLYHAQIRAAFKHMRGERMAQGVRMEILHPDSHTGSRHDAENALTGKPTASRVQKHRIGRLRIGLHKL